MWTAIVVVGVSFCLIVFVIVCGYVIRQICTEAPEYEWYIHPMWYVTYAHQNQPAGRDGGLWQTRAPNPDAALATFRCCPYCTRLTRVVCCTRDYSYACACLLED